jgi:hypothetical protein
VLAPFAVAISVPPTVIFDIPCAAPTVIVAVDPAAS